MYERIKAGQFDVVEALRFLAERVERLDGPASVAPEVAVSAGDVVAPAKEGLAALFSDRLVKVLVSAGLETPKAVMVATDDQLRGINGIGPTTLGDIRQVLPYEGAE